MLIAPYTVLYYSMYDELRCRGKPWPSPSP